MKIGLVCPYNMARAGGVQECVLAMRRELLHRGHEALIITPLPREFRKQKPAGMVFVGAAADIKSFKTTAQVSASADMTALQALLDSHNFDILHFHEPWVPMLSRQILSRSNSINIATFHAKLPERFMTRTIERVITPYTSSILKSLDAYTAVSDAAAGYVRSLMGSKVEIIPNGIDLSKYSADARSQKETKTILYIGRLENRKGVKYLLRAYKVLNERYKDLQLIIAGDGPDRFKLERLAYELRLPKVKFLGFISEKRKQQLLKEDSVFCSPALYGESFGIVLLEAMASGLPIVAGDNAGYESVMQDHGKISLVNPKDIYSFARQLEIMIYDDDLRKLWLKWAKNYVKQFDYSKVVDRYESLYGSELKRKTVRSR